MLSLMCFCDHSSCAQTYGNPVPEHLLPPRPPNLLNDYVLVLTVEDFLIHQDWTVRGRENMFCKGWQHRSRKRHVHPSQPVSGWRTVKRPHLDTFLAYCVNLFGEVVLFSDKHIIVRCVWEPLSPTVRSACAYP